MEWETADEYRELARTRFPENSRPRLLDTPFPCTGNLPVTLVVNTAKLHLTLTKRLGYWLER